MHINGVKQRVVGMTLGDIGTLLAGASPTKDGLNITLILTAEESAIFADAWGLKFGEGVRNLIQKGHEKLYGAPCAVGFEYDFTSRTFKTTGE